MNEIDDALAKAMSAPPDQRGPVWAAWTDSLLDMKLRLQAGTRYSPSKITRIVHAQETR